MTHTTPRVRQVPDAGVPDLTPVDGCRHCGLPRLLPDGLPHARRWSRGPGWHGWTAPTQQQIKDRMIARRADRIVTGRLAAGRPVRRELP
ncbi:hypothetical protein [Actinomadura opuntiae]|uniref:hypothetical protein n=1 Tax=Actinomadura sp. OS1-43 TaxID=604315 RepID=UPI00255B1843|nr:hypothetical protein [Actinomadura sp. OS1-43]MDL4812743.1 hypothetical protein [Actinomadura sp. OS1-43]